VSTHSNQIDPPDPEYLDHDPAEIDAADEADVAHFNFKASKTQTQRIDQFLSGRVSYLSRSAVQRLIDDGLVRVNGKSTKASYKLKEGDRVEMVAPPEPVNELVPEPIPLDIVYEDEHFLALNKQADLIVHPARGRWTGTLVNGLVYYGRKWSTINGEWRPGILHRRRQERRSALAVGQAVRKPHDPENLSRCHPRCAGTPVRCDRRAHWQGQIHP
jgi:23S rRNA pseudouridine1911/1915/1917 synthase